MPRITLTNNDSGKFECRWVHLSMNQKSRCVFYERDGKHVCPGSAREGKFAGDLRVITDKNIAVYYTDEQGDRNALYPFNPNGSVKISPVFVTIQGGCLV